MPELVRCSHLVMDEIDNSFRCRALRVRVSFKFLRLQISKHRPLSYVRSISLLCLLLFRLFKSRLETRTNPPPVFFLPSPLACCTRGTTEPLRSITPLSPRSPLASARSRSPTGETSRSRSTTTWWVSFPPLNRECFLSVVERRRTVYFILWVVCIAPTGDSSAI